MSRLEANHAELYGATQRWAVELAGRQLALAVGEAGCEYLGWVLNKPLLGGQLRLRTEAHGIGERVRAWSRRGTK